MIDVDLIHEHRVSKQARETSKHPIDCIWLSHAFLKLALTQKHTCSILAVLSSIHIRCPSYLYLFCIGAQVENALRRHVAPPRELRLIK